VDTSGIAGAAAITNAGDAVSVPGKGMIVLQALAETRLPDPMTPAAAAVPAIAPVPVPTADAFASEPVEQSIIPPGAEAPETPVSASSEPDQAAKTPTAPSQSEGGETPAKPKRQRAVAPRRPSQKAPRKRPENGGDQ